MVHNNLSKFKKHYPNWKQQYNTKKIIKELIENSSHMNLTKFSYAYSRHGLVGFINVLFGKLGLNTE